ncbi:predicted protein [Chaetoceros tenuissimus]|uniref:F-box domain-containing protein n=1 Tax=Chaetoceros tenuissimus TaxID=426638 RepID=A0AAD3CZN5_9STRA|nr:predicted protein [Chaetoceros tenuissimus]
MQMKPTSDSVQRQQELSKLESLPDDIFTKILTYFIASKQDESCNMEGVAFLYKSFSLVSKRLRRYCDVFCQTVPIDVMDQWQDNYNMIACICRAKMKLSSLAVRDTEMNMRVSLFLYMLEKCDLSQLQVLDVRSFSSFRQRQDADTISKASEAGIPKHIFHKETEIFNEAKHVDTDASPFFFNMKIEELVLRGIRNVGNDLPIQDLRFVLDFCDNEHSAGCVMDIITSCKDLQHLFFHVRYMATERLLIDVTKAIETLSKMKSLEVSVHDNAKGKFDIKSDSIIDMIVSSPECEINQIICPKLKKLDVCALKFGESFLDSFASTSLETLTFTLQDFTLQEFESEPEENHRQQSFFVHNFIKMLPELKTLTLGGDGSTDSFPTRLRIESNSLEMIDATSIHTDMKLNFTHVSCPNLKHLAVFVDRDDIFFHSRYYCPIEVGNEELLLRLGLTIQTKIEEGLSDEERSDGVLRFATERTNTDLLSTLDIPESCIIFFQAYIP